MCVINFVDHSINEEEKTGNMAGVADRGVPLSTLSPKFLHSNSTSHTWPFSAIAELIDNAYDPDVSAKQFWIDKTVVKGEQCLCFMDNGNGLDSQTMHKMLSFGYSDKTAVNGLEPIGIYGNGFKSGSMRLGRDAIVFSKSMSTSCVGMLSQTYLEKIEADQIIVPIVCLERQKNNNRSVSEEYKASLKDILQYSPFKTLEELLTEIDAISQHWSSTKTGTRVIIWNLRRTSSGTTEFDFDQDRYDIRIPSEIYETMSKSTPHVDSISSYTPESVFSLRAYCSILYLKPRMQIIVRGVKVKSQLIAKSLAWIRKDYYRPTFLNNKVSITFGYNTKSKDQYGIMMYHKNRLIKAYERVGCQLKANSKGLGVIGVIECNFLEPTHNKQNFLESDKYRKTMTNLSIKLEEYWREIRFRKSKENPNSVVPVEDTVKQPDQNWVQCDECLHWRKLPDGIDCSKLPDKWFCRMNPDPQFRSCEIDEEPEDSDDDQKYVKTYKEQEKEDRRKQMADEQKRQEQQRFTELARKTEALQQRQQDLRRSLREAAIQSPSTPLTPRNRSLQGGAVRAESSPQLFSNISQAACSPSSNSGLPVITNVCSLSVDTQSRKRKHPITALASKKPQVNGLPRSSSDAPTPVGVSSASSPAVPIPSDDNEDTDDDIFILENASTPKPKQTVPEIKKPKIVKDESEVEISMLLDCTDDAAVDVSSEVEGAHSAAETEKGAGSSVAAPPKMTTSTTQTEMCKVKQEVLSQNSTEMHQRAMETGGSKDRTEQGCDSSSCSVEKTVVKQENQEDDYTVEREHQEEEAGPSRACAYDKTQYPAHLNSVTKFQEQQDQLMELMQNTAQERDSLKEQVDQLTLKLVKCTGVNIKKECSHKANQTDVTEEMNYKNLFEKAKQKVDELIKDKEALLSARDNKTNPPAHQGRPENMDEIALQVENLLHKLDQTNKEKEELASQVQSLEEEKTRLAAKCEEFRLMLQRPRDEEPTTSASSARPHPEDEGQPSNSDRNSDTFQSLIQLRHNIGRYLVPRVPALDLDQVNFECNVIDEILEQLLSS